MTKRSFRQRFIRAAIALAMGGSAFQLSGCDPAVRNTLLGGLQITTLDLAGTLITAFFETLDDGEDGGAGTNGGS